MARGPRRPRPCFPGLIHCVSSPPPRVCPTPSSWACLWPPWLLSPTSGPTLLSLATRPQTGPPMRPCTAGVSKVRGLLSGRGLQVQRLLGRQPGLGGWGPPRGAGLGQAGRGAKEGTPGSFCPGQSWGSGPQPCFHLLSWGPGDRREGQGASRGPQCPGRVAPEQRGLDPAALRQECRTQGGQLWGKLRPRESGCGPSPTPPGP